MNIFKCITLDMNEGTSRQVVSCRQNDNGKRLIISLNQSGRPYFVDDDVRVVVAGTRSDGFTFFNEATVEDGRVFYELTEQNTSAVGTARAELRLYKGEQLIASPAFVIEVTASAMDDGEVIEGAEATALTQLLQEADTALKTMQTETDEALDRMQATAITAAEISVDNSVGEPAATVELIPGEDGQTIRFALSNVKGDKGDKGEKGEKGEKGDSPVVIEGKMEQENPSGYGSISVNRKADSEVGEFSVAIGKDNIASGYASHAEGCNNEASDKYAHAEGYGCIASGEHAHAEGRDTVASGIHSHAEGCGCKASRAVTHAEGWYTFAYGRYSHVEGDSSETRGDTSHAEGLYTQANGSYQHVQGKYNIADDSDKYAHIVGNGTDVNNRSNAHTLDWQGNAWFSGQVFMGGTGMDDPRAMKLGSGGYVIHVPAEEASIDEETGEVTLTLTESRDNFGPVLEAGGTVWLDLSATPMAEMLGMPSLSLSVMMWAYVEGMGLILLSSTPMFNVMANVQNGTWTPGGTT